MPVVQTAYALHAQGAAFVRFALECRLLAGEPPEAISKKNAISPAVIQTYELLYYDVRPYLDHPDYVSMTIQNGPEELEWRQCKALAYRGGPLVADAVLQLATAQKPTDPDQVAGFFAKDQRATMALKPSAWQLGRCRPWIPGVAAKIIGMDRTVADAGEGAGSTDTLGQHIQDMMQEVGKSLSLMQPGENGFYGCVEPRVADRMQLAMGVEPPHLVALKDQKFPQRDQS